MYRKNFVVVVKTTDGKILRECGECASLPFGSEYILVLKNLNSRKAKVSVQIDGQDALGNDHLLVRPNRETELTGFLTGQIVKNRFKFIKKTKEISDYRGDRVDDSLIRVEYWFEKKCVTERVDIEHHHHDVHHYHTHIPYYRQPFVGPRRLSRLSSRGISDGDSNITCHNISSDFASASKGFCDSGQVSFSSSGDMGMCNLEPQQDEQGITVKGSHTQQHFNTAYIGELEEQSSVITLKLKGYTGKHEIVRKPITVKTKITCETCGKKSKSSAKFCDRCGTSLI